MFLLADDAKIEPLDYVQLSRATSFPLLVVKNCVQETILLYCFLLRNKEHVPFAYKDIGVLTCKGDFLCIKFYLDCVKRLESTAGLVALQTKGVQSFSTVLTAVSVVSSTWNGPSHSGWSFDSLQVRFRTQSPAWNECTGNFKGGG